LGCLLAAKLSRDHEVWLLDHDPVRAALLDDTGLLLEDTEGITRHFVHVTSEATLVGKVELTLLCVKSHKVEDAVKGAWSAIQGGGLFLALQNGIGHLEVLPALCREMCWGLGATSQGATMAGPGRVLHRGSGPTWIGLSSAQSDAGGVQQAFCRKSLIMAAAALSEAGIPTEAVDEILPRLWDKLLVNVGINALTAINDCPNGALLDDPGTAAMMSAAVGEAVVVAERLGIKLNPDPLAMVRNVCRATATNISSMLQDVRAGRPTEIEAINGAVVRLADSLGVSAPMNEDLVRKVRELERNCHVFY
jgi:2-dehydropantoate 2-reductase